MAWRTWQHYRRQTLFQHPLTVGPYLGVSDKWRYQQRMNGDFGDFAGKGTRWNDASGLAR